MHRVDFVGHPAGPEIQIRGRLRHGPGGIRQTAQHSAAQRGLHLDRFGVSGGDSVAPRRANLDPPGTTAFQHHRPAAIRAKPHGRAASIIHLDINRHKFRKIDQEPVALIQQRIACALIGDLRQLFLNLGQTAQDGVGPLYGLCGLFAHVARQHVDPFRQIGHTPGQRCARTQDRLPQPLILRHLRQPVERIEKSIQQIGQAALTRQKAIFQRLHMAQMRLCRAKRAFGIAAARSHQPVKGAADVHHIHAAPLLSEVRTDFFQIRQPPNIALYKVAFATGIVDFLLNTNALLGINVTDTDLGAFSGITQCNGPAKAACAACYEYSLCHSVFR